ncbi:MAG: hypothetical protein RR313_04995, partial [Anaerovoracaceae bacterium]
SLQPSLSRLPLRPAADENILWGTAPFALLVFIAKAVLRTYENLRFSHRSHPHICFLNISIITSHS